MKKPIPIARILVTLVAFHLWASRAESETSGGALPITRSDEDSDGSAASLVLVQDGRPLATIVVPSKPDRWTRLAASWLQDYVARSTAAKLPIVEEGEPTSGVVISVGHTKLAEAAKIANPDWKWDTARNVCRDNKLFLLGRDDTTADVGERAGDAGPVGARGTCKAVATFLEDQCGVRWFLPAPDGELVPKRTELCVPISLDRTVVPAFAFSVGRYPYGVGTPASFANNFRSAIKLQTYGGHSYYSWLPAAEYFQDHPEYFALINGKRTPERNHLCSSNPEVREILIRRLREQFDAGYDWVELGQEDDYARCECAKCEALDRYRGELPPDWYEMYDQAGFDRLRKTPCERLLLLHKAIADAALASHPDKTVHLLIYRQTLVPSERFERFGPNVVGEICNINPQAVIPWKGKVRAQTAYLYWFDITLGLGLGLHTTPRQAVDRIRYLSDNNFLGLFQLPDTNWGLMGPVYWTIAKSMGDPQLDSDQLLAEYCQGVYEDAAPEMQRFYELLYKRDIVAVERSSAADQHLFYYPPALCVQLEGLLAAAEASAKTERAEKWVRLTREHFDYLKYLSFLLTAYQAHEANPSEANRAEWIAALGTFDDYRQHIVDLDDNYTSRWFPGHDQFANFLTANGENVYYVPWAQRRNDVQRDGVKGTVLGFGGPGIIREPFAVAP